MNNPTALSQQKTFLIRRVMVILPHFGSDSIKLWSGYYRVLPKHTLLLEVITKALQFETVYVTTCKYRLPLPALPPQGAYYCTWIRLPCWR